MESRAWIDNCVDITMSEDKNTRIVENRSDITYKVGDIVELKSKHIAKIVNINELREPCMKYAVDIEGFLDVAFIGDEAISRKLEVNNG